MVAAPHSIPCPFLPVINRPYTANDIHDLGRDRSSTFYNTALHYAQSLWLEGFPAKSLLLVNRALSCWLPEVSLKVPGESPYHAVAWLLQNRPPGFFVGNPRRHYQHLATRMVEPHKTLRTWRAWACWYLSKHLLSESEFPSDEKQIREELIVEPTRDEIARQLTALSPQDDCAAWLEALAWAGESWQPVATSEVVVTPVSETDLPIVQALAHRIWRAVYPAIISTEQIDYMLEQMYSLPHLQEEMLTHGVRYRLISAGGNDAAGFLAWQSMADDESACLHKLYLLPELHGKGLGARALQFVMDEAKAAGAKKLRLRVNRENRGAIRAYLRQGFAFEEDLCTDIGGGFVMDDHVMVREL
ncbi:MAG: GNAT family N-acetyltransferase [Verrucomicrobium sp.]|nr:GNAT family N-acetyltransferase [Verrucomicrobium sp.]